MVEGQGEWGVGVARRNLITATTPRPLTQADAAANQRPRPYAIYLGTSTPIRTKIAPDATAGIDKGIQHAWNCDERVRY